MARKPMQRRRIPVKRGGYAVCQAKDWGVQCTRKPALGKARCEPHLEADRKKQRAARERAREEGLCTRCRVRPAEQGSSCDECRRAVRMYALVGPMGRDPAKVGKRRSWRTRLRPGGKAVRRRLAAWRKKQAEEQDG